MTEQTNQKVWDRDAVRSYPFVISLDPAGPLARYRHLTLGDMDGAQAMEIAYEVLDTTRFENLLSLFTEEQRDLVAEAVLHAVYAVANDVGTLRKIDLYMTLVRTICAFYASVNHQGRPGESVLHLIQAYDALGLTPQQRAVASDRPAGLPFNGACPLSIVRFEHSL